MLATTALQRPTLTAVHTTNAPLPAHHSRLVSAAARGRSMALDEILQSSPYESEAETYILKAIEKQNRPRTSTMDSTFWSMAEQAAPDLDDVPMHTTPETPQAPHPTGPCQPKGEDSTGQELSNGEAKPTFDIPKPSVELSRQSSATSLSQHHARERHPLLGKKPPRILKRQVSVQDHLQDLTSAMQALDDNETTSHEADPDSETTEPRRKEDTTRAHHRRHGSADQFATNAIRLYETADQVPQGPNVTPGAAGKGHRRWGTLDNNLSILEEDSASVLSEHSDKDGLHVRDDQNQDAPANDGAPLSTKDPTQKRLSGRRRGVLMRMAAVVKEDFAIWSRFIRLRSVYAWRYFKNALCYIILPATAISAILFYVGQNPPTGRGTENAISASASASWWLLFICVRQMITLMLAFATQALVIDFLGLETKILLRFLGPVLSLLIVQSKGWPCIVMFWAMFDFILLQGDWPLAHHWGYFQSYVGLFNADNPSGNIVDSHWNQVILGTAIGVSGVTSIKRFLIGLYQGRQLFAQYGHQLAKLMKKMLLISQVAGLAKEIEETANSPGQISGWNDDALGGFSFSELDDADDDSASLSRVDADKKGAYTGTWSRHGTHHLHQLLDEWEEPDVDRQGEDDEDITISAVLKFRKALFFIQKEYPFSYSFGAASSREECVASAQAVYERLLLHRKDRGYLHFETIALLALNSKGRLDTDKARQLIKVFRPDRDGKLDLVDFVKSIDAIYKRYRLLLASIANTNAIDRASERIFNVAYYALVIVVVTTVWGFDPLAIFLSLSSIVLGFAFMIGKASANYFDGVLFILVRRPYGIGDRIHISNIEQDTDINGSLGWVVENITLFETTAVWTPTRERCSLANGSLAQSRIINGARSPQAQFLIPFKFPINTPYDKILIFKAAVEEYLKARPREWLMMTGFRAARIAPDLGFIEYVMHIMHRESWQQHTQLQDSKANFQSYCLEVSTQLGMHYTAPPLPVDLRHPSPTTSGADGTSDLDSSARIEGFRSLAMTQHKIGWVGN